MQVGRTQFRRRVVRLKNQTDACTFIDGLASDFGGKDMRKYALVEWDEGPSTDRMRGMIPKE
jgi:hypothetical protein